MIQFTRGLDADYFLGEGDYATFIETHLMPHLTGIRRGEGVRAPAGREREPEYPGRPGCVSCLLHSHVGGILGRHIRFRLRLPQQDIDTLELLMRPRDLQDTLRIC
ncbi:hypothetical protein CsSME_00019654 [Camellia sinensis var. sinensis]